MGKIDDNSADENAEQMEVQLGRRAPFTMVGDWVLLAAISRQAKLLYWALSAHLSSTRGDRDVWPTQAMLAEILDFAPIKGDPAELRDGRKIRPFLKELAELGAVEVRKVRSPQGMRERSIYTLHETPPRGYSGKKSFGAFYEDRRKRVKRAAQQEAAGRGVQGELDLGTEPQPDTPPEAAPDAPPEEKPPPKKPTPRRRKST